MEWISFFTCVYICVGRISPYSYKLNKEDITIIYRAQCPHSQAALKTLRGLKYGVKEIEEKSNPELVNYVRKYIHPTFPMIFVHGEFIGGNDEFQKKLKSGEIDKMMFKLTNKNGFLYYLFVNTIYSFFLFIKI
ncbi:glutaredoxin [Vairimorpha necatrix]|uniref:Glutaredoxin n=1 Tax=Vairimorpha necatrix TaxID=6039 RepID=A0AAX4JD86_9MICR